MPRINLLNKIKKYKIQKRDSYKNAVWIIVKLLNNQEYFVFKVSKKGNNSEVVWTNDPFKSMKFHTEKGCQQFVRTQLKNRSDIHLKWIEITN